MGCVRSELIESYSLNNYEFESHFNYHYSYLNHSTYPLDYFDAREDGLYVSLHKGDAPFKEGSETYPRTELRHLYTLQEGVDYEVSFFMTLLYYRSGFDFSFFQAFGNSANLMFRQRQGVYQVCALRSKVKILRTPYSVEQDIGAERHWIFKFRMHRKSGYFEVFRDGVSLGRIDGDTRGRRGYIKFGLYAQQMQPDSDITARFRNFNLTRCV